MKTNTAVRNTNTTHEGATARRITPEQELKRSVLSCMLFEKEFYEDGQAIAERIRSLAMQCKPEFVASLAIAARSQFNLRHVPLMLLLSLIKRGGKTAGDAIFATVQRADELAELVALYWHYNPDKDLSKQMKRGLAKAFGKFNEYQLAKYNRQDAAVKLRDVLFLCHAKPTTPEREALYKRLACNELATPNTWESRLTSGEDKKAVFTDLIQTKELGYLALLRNLRGMNEAGVDHGIIKEALLAGDHSRVLPFRFIAAARHAPMFERELDTAMVNALDKVEKLPGQTVLLVDVSGSMDEALSAKSDLKRCDAAAGLAILLSGICENVRVFIFGNTVREVPARKGMALRDLVQAQNEGTYLGQAVTTINQLTYDRLIVITDEQSHDPVRNAKANGYMLNVASARNGVGYGPWIHIDGFSEACVAFIREYESQANQ